MEEKDQMVQKELADKERDKQIAIANEVAQKAMETTEHISLVRHFIRMRTMLPDMCVRQILTAFVIRSLY